MSEDVKARVLEMVRREPSPTRVQARWRQALMLAAAASASTMIWLWAGGARIQPRPMSLVVLTALGSLALAGGALWTALGRGGSMMGRPRPWLWAMAISMPLALLAWKVGCSARDPQMMAAWPGRIGLRCLGLSLATAASPLMAFLWSNKGGDPVHPRSAGLALGVAAGSCAWVLVDLWCPVAHPRHLLLGHVLPVAILAAAGALVGGRLLSIRTR